MVVINAVVEREIGSVCRGVLECARETGARTRSDQRHVYSAITRFGITPARRNDRKVIREENGDE